MENEIVKMEAPKGVSCCSVQGVMYKPQKKGFFFVNKEHVTELIQHGFSVVQSNEFGSETEITSDVK